LKPSSALDVEFTQDQAALIQPTMIQCNTGVIIDEMRGDGAKKRMARRHLDMVNGNISSYCQVLNSKDQLDHMKEVTLLTASVDEVTKENEADRQRRMDKRKQDAADRTKKDAERKVMTEHKAIESKPKCAALMDEINDKGRDHVKKLTAGQLKMLLQYEFNLTAAN
jgi:23S rRNA pseudoU1915 N3-methylase RlmH